MQHYIIVKWKEDAEKKVLSEKVRTLYADAAKIEGIHNVVIKDNVTPRSNRYDVMIVLDMDADALPIWDASELHKRWKSEYGERIEKKCIFDGE